MRIRENLSSITHSQNKNPTQKKENKKVGIVYGVITTENTPTKKQFERAGGYNAIGSVFYKNYTQFNNEETINDELLDTCQIAKPISVNTSLPLIGELVNIIVAPSQASSLSKNANQSYYTNAINLSGNVQQNSISNNPLGNTFIEKADIRNLIPFEGDVIYQGRKGNGIRFGSTTKNIKANEWSETGEDGDPITILVNGYVTTDKNLLPNVEEINKEKASIYLTSTQTIPLEPDLKGEINPFTKPLYPNKYLFSQILMNADRITLNSKKNELMFFAKTNIELCTKNVINLNAGSRTHINSPIILLGTKDGGKAPTEPLLLGNKTKDLLNDLISLLGELGNDLSSVISTPKGSPLVGVNMAGKNVISKLSNIQNKLKEINSTSNFTV